MGKLDQEKFGAYAKLYMNSKYGIFLLPVFFCTNSRSLGLFFIAWLSLLRLKTTRACSEGEVTL